MDQELETICCELIAGGGEARSMVLEALECGRQGKISEAPEKLERSRELMVQIHKLQVKLLQIEARGEEVSRSLLLVHAQDILMAGITELDLSEFILALFEEIHSMKSNSD